MKVKYILVKAKIRYWEDSSIDGKEDTEAGDLAPCKQGDIWSPKINVATGVIENWEMGKTAKIHYKVADGCGYDLLGENDSIIASQDDGYVPNTLCPAEKGYGDYIIMDIDAKGQIEKWKFNVDEFIPG